VVEFDWEHELVQTEFNNYRAQRITIAELVARVGRLMGRLDASFIKTIKTYMRRHNISPGSAEVPIVVNPSRKVYKKPKLNWEDPRVHALIKKYFDEHDNNLSGLATRLSPFIFGSADQELATSTLCEHLQNHRLKYTSNSISTRKRSSIADCESLDVEFVAQVKREINDLGDQQLSKKQRLTAAPLVSPPHSTIIRPNQLAALSELGEDLGDGMTMFEASIRISEITNSQMTQSESQNLVLKVKQNQARKSVRKFRKGLMELDKLHDLLEVLFPRRYTRSQLLDWLYKGGHMSQRLLHQQSFNNDHDARVFLDESIEIAESLRSMSPFCSPVINATEFIGTTRHQDILLDPVCARTLAPGGIIHCIFYIYVIYVIFFYLHLPYFIYFVDGSSSALRTPPQVTKGDLSLVQHYRPNADEEFRQTYLAE
jgi:hypothetical protein